MISIVACDQYGIIGDKGRIPWNVPEDMAFFRKMTSGHIVIMGRKTFDSLSSPLKNRINIVITRDPVEPDTSVLYYRNMDTIFPTIENLKSIYPDKKVFVIGGNEIYTLFSPYTEKIYMTTIYRKENNGDTFLPPDILDFICRPDFRKETIILKSDSVNTVFQYEISVFG